MKDLETKKTEALRSKNVRVWITIEKMIEEEGGLRFVRRHLTFSQLGDNELNRLHAEVIIWGMKEGGFHIEEERSCMLNFEIR